MTTLKKILLTTLLSTATLFAGFTNVECNNTAHLNTLHITEGDCKALESFWDATGQGTGWLNVTGWNTVTSVETWYGRITLHDSGVGIKWFFVEDNNISGELTDGLSNFTNLISFGVRGNNFSNIPIALHTLDTLLSLDLASNKYSGNLPEYTELAPNLQYLYFFNNKFTGKIPNSYSQFTNLINITSGYNQLSGALPELSHFSFEYFRISNNNFTFSDLEPQIDNIRDVENLDYTNQAPINETNHPTVYFDDTLTIEPSLAINPSGNDYYTWKKEGVDIAGPDGSRIYVKTGASIADNGNYSYEVNNSKVTLPDGSGIFRNLVLHSNTTIKAIHNNTPVLSNPTPLTQTTENELYTYTSNISDEDSSDTLTVTSLDLPAWLTLTAEVNNFTLSGTPTTDDIGSYDVNITVTDGKIPVHINYVLVVKSATQVNNAPTITGTPSTEVNAGETYTFTPTASDTDGDTLTYSIVNKPSWATFDTATGELTGTPQESDVKSYENISITVSDSVDEATLPAFNINVKSLITLNETPTITGTPNTTVNAEETYTFTPTTIDAEGDTLTCSITNKPSWATFSTTTGALTGTPQESDVGTTSNIVITVSDSKATASLPAFDLEVKTAESVTPLPTEPDPETNTTEEPASSGGGGAMGLEFLLVLLLMLGFKRKGE